MYLVNYVINIFLIICVKIYYNVKLIESCNYNNTKSY